GLDDEAERTLETRSDHDLVGCAGNVARDPQIARDRLAQRLIAQDVVGMRELLGIDAAHHARCDLRPLLARKDIERRQPHLKQELPRWEAQPLRPALWFR